MAETKQLVLVVESTSALRDYWPTIVSVYLDKIIRSFCGDLDTILDNPTVELGLVNYNVRGPFSSNWLVQKSSLTKNMETFMGRLSAIDFTSYGFCHAAIAEGLSEALMMFSSVNGIQNHQRHCILVAASNPHPLPTQVYIRSDDSGMTSESHNFDAETVAKYFKQFGVSLSVISPKQLRKLQAIYNAAKRNPLESDTPIDIVKNPKYLVLISKDFMDARDALSQPEITILPSYGGPIIDLTQDFYPETPPTLNSPEIRLVPIEQRVLEKISATPVKDPSTTSLMAASSQAESTIIPAGTSTVPTNVVNDNVASKVGPTQQTSSTLQSKPLKYVKKSDYVKLWEGELAYDCKRQLQRVIVTRLEGYREKKACDSFAKDWPTTLLIDRIISRDELNLQKYTGKKDYPIFEAFNKHPLLVNLLEKKLCAVINLPSQVLLLLMQAIGGFYGVVMPQVLLLLMQAIGGFYGVVMPQEMVKDVPDLSGQPKEDAKGHDSSQGKQSMISIN